MRSLSILICIAALLAFLPSAQAQQLAPTEKPVASPVLPGFVLRASVAPEVGFMFGGGASALHLAGRLDLYIGHDLLAGGTEASRVGLSAGYLGSLSVNHVEVLHRHGAGLSIHNGVFLLTAGGGLTLAHDYATRSTIPGGHVAIALGCQWGNFTLTLPYSVDFFPVGSQLVQLMNISLALGVSTN